ncbi:MAG: glycoside hydrolase family 3 N-terminal domain-containing protein [Candidatus Aminicenantia bacterium]
MRVKILFFLILLIIFTFFSFSEEGKYFVLSSGEREWVEKTLRNMTLDEKIGQLIMLPFSGRFVNLNSEYFKTLSGYIRDYHLGGFILFGGEIYEASVLINELQRISKIPLFISSDFERGAGNQLTRAVSFPYLMAIGATGSEDYAYFQGKITALEARAIGINWTYAPVVDVNSNPDNPIINIRAIGEVPELVARLASAFIRGCQDYKLIATAKHFPGHGDTSLDSHTTLAFINADRERLERMELYPFKIAIKNGVKSIMTAHLAVPSIDENTPSTLSEKIINGILRKELAFKGLVVTDAMNMGGIVNNYWVGEAAVKAIKAGVDMVLMPPNPKSSFEAIKEAVKRGDITEKRVDESVERILSAKAWLGIHKNRFSNIEKLNKIIADPVNIEKAEKIAESAITLLRNDDRLIPFDPRSKKRLLFLAIMDENNPSLPVPFFDEIRSRYEYADTKVINNDTDPKTLLSILERINDYDAIIGGIFVRTFAQKNTIALPATLANFVKTLSLQKKPFAVISFSNPYLIRQFSELRNYICAYGYSEILQRAAVRAIFGFTDIKGRLPVSIPGIFKIGDGIQVEKIETSLKPLSADEESSTRELIDNVSRIINDSIKDGAFPGGAIAIGKGGKLIMLKGFGKLSYEKNSSEVNPETIYDLASLTKVVVTTTACMKLYEKGELKLNSKVSSYIPEFGKKGKENITVWHLLTHSSGLPAYRRYFLETKGKENILKRICDEELEYEPGTKSVYSDLGFILLGVIVEKVSGENLENYIKKVLFEPLGMKNTMFNPPDRLKARIAPTEDDPWRKRIVKGEVHDENAYAMGGVSGHAGLFSTTEDLAKFCQLLLNGGIYGGKRILKRSTIEYFTRKAEILESTRALGWDTPSKEGSTAGKFVSTKAFGHTGFTGTSIWIDPEKEIFVVLLTNRVHLTRENQKIKEVRPRVHDAVFSFWK